MEVNGALVLAQVVVSNAQIAQGAAFPSAITNLAGDRQVLFIEVNGALVLAQAVVSTAQIAQGAAFPSAITNLAGNG
jgi:hypothetical protein